MRRRQDFEAGWQSISLYTGASIHEMQRAGRDGELGRIDLHSPVVAHRVLEAWIFARLLPAQLVDDDVELVADDQQPPQSSAA